MEESKSIIDFTESTHLHETEESTSKLLDLDFQKQASKGTNPFVRSNENSAPSLNSMILKPLDNISTIQQGLPTNRTQNVMTPAKIQSLNVDEPMAGGAALVMISGSTADLVLFE